MILGGEFTVDDKGNIVVAANSKGSKFFDYFGQNTGGFADIWKLNNAPGFYQNFNPAGNAYASIAGVTEYNGKTFQGGLIDTFTFGNKIASSDNNNSVKKESQIGVVSLSQFHDYDSNTKKSATEEALVQAGILEEVSLGGGETGVRLKQSNTQSPNQAQGSLTGKDKDVLNALTNITWAQFINIPDAMKMMTQDGTKALVSLITDPNYKAEGIIDHGLVTPDQNSPLVNILGKIISGGILQTRPDK
jgi:hypothetical protein